MHRINSFRLSNPCIYDHVRLSLESMLQFDRMENLILDNIEYIQLARLLKRLCSLSRLLALTITVEDDVTDEKIIYQQIFRLPALKYCKLSFLTSMRRRSLPMCNERPSPIEYLIIKNPVYVHELNTLLSYVPQLRRLSLHLEQDPRRKKTETRPSVCNHLRDLSLRLDKVKFDVFEQMIQEFFWMIEVLHLTRTGEIDAIYFDVNRWERLITSSLSHLRIFDIRYDYPVHEDLVKLARGMQMKEFSIAFWITRHWSFAHCFYSRQLVTYGSFYSTNPYRYDSQNIDIM